MHLANIYSRKTSYEKSDMLILKHKFAKGRHLEKRWLIHEFFDCHCVIMVGFFHVIL